MIRLYELPENQNIRLYVDNEVIIFDHIDGLYSYCWFEEDETKIVHINACTQLKKYKDGYKIESDNYEKENSK